MPDRAARRIAQLSALIQGLCLRLWQRETGGGVAGDTAFWMGQAGSCQTARHAGSHSYRRSSKGYVSVCGSAKLVCTYKVLCPPYAPVSPKTVLCPQKQSSKQSCVPKNSPEFLHTDDVAKTQLELVCQTAKAVN